MACNLIFSFLNGRSQAVNVNMETSSFLSLHRGVPQGSILGPVLFTMFVNDLPSVVKHSSVFIYADDVQMLHSTELSDPNRCVTELSFDFDMVLNWAKENSLVLNAGKSKSIVFRTSLNQFH